MKYGCLNITRCNEDSFRVGKQGQTWYSGNRGGNATWNSSWLSKWTSQSKNYRPDVHLVRTPASGPLYLANDKNLFVWMQTLHLRKCKPPFTRMGLCVHADILPWGQFTLTIFAHGWYNALKSQTLQGPMSRSESASMSVCITTLEQLQIKIQGHIKFFRRKNTITFLSQFPSV